MKKVSFLIVCHFKAILLNSVKDHKLRSKQFSFANLFRPMRTMCISFTSSVFHKFWKNIKFIECC